MQLVPRWYQNDCVAAIWQYFMSKSGNPLCALPTATGKSVIIAMFLESVFINYPNQKIICLTHVKELISQNYKKLLQLWPGAPAGVNSAGLGIRAIYDRIIFAGIQSVAKIWSSFGHVDLLIIDEAHLVSPEEETMYQLFIKGLTSINPNLKVIGFTATPWRLGHGKLTEAGLFTDVCYDLTDIESFNRLIVEGYLCPLIPKATDTKFDLSEVKQRGGEYIPGQLQNAVNREEVTRRALREACHIGSDRKHWLVFATGVEHAINVGEMLEQFHVPNVVIHSKLSDYERDKRIDLLLSGKVMAGVNNNVLTTGFDFPAIDFIPVLRPTLSSVLWVQMLGRGMRPFAGKVNCLVADYAGNTAKLGPVNDPVIPKKKGERPGVAPVKLCETCNTYNHASVRQCVCCGQEFPLIVKIKAEASTRELISGDVPVTEVFKVEHITVSEHYKPGKGRSIRVSHYCNSGGNIQRKFDEFICIEHENQWALKKGREWWAKRSNEPIPKTTAEAIMLFEFLKMPTHIRVWTNKGKYAEILAHCFDGTAFGAEVVSSDVVVRPTIETAHTRKKKADAKGTEPVHVDNFDDDIPF